jgi:hypothetical protein
MKKIALLEVEKISSRTPYKTDAHGNSVEGGALNANYTLVDAVARVCNTLGRHGYVYGKDFVWDDSEHTDELEEALSIRYDDPQILTVLGMTS